MNNHITVSLGVKSKVDKLFLIERILMEERDMKLTSELKILVIDST